MDSLSCSLDGRSFHALLTGLTKHLFYGDTTITVDFLADQLYSGIDLTDAEAKAQITAFSELLSGAAVNDWDPSRLENAARAGNISTENCKILTLFWTTERQKIHSTIVDKSIFNDQLQHCFWRVDVKVASKQHAELNDPVAVVELNTRSATKTTKTSGRDPNRIVRFDMGREEMGGLLKSLESIQKKIEELAT